ncbi:MAG: tyrosine/phenylalanine carboxypeptidase domain-containing protein [Microgenomates group bacterium]
MSFAIFENYLRNLIPSNLSEEKARFFADQNYNPQLAYSVPISFEHPPYKGSIQITHLAKAKSILEDVSAQFGTEEKYVIQTEGELLTEEDVLSQITEYLIENNVLNIVKLVFTTDAPSRTAFEKLETGYELRIRKPVEYRKFALRGMLHHEIGTHLFRWRNQEILAQKLDPKLTLNDFRETEEGLASFHSLLENKAPYLWTPALYYYTVAMAAQKSFAELFLDLEKFVANPARRWELTMRAKRGLADTSQPGGFFKDQTYLTGAIEVAKWITMNPTMVRLLYLGKIALSDIKLIHEQGKEPTFVPIFLTDEKKYLDRMKEIFTFNHLL